MYQSKHFTLEKIKEGIYAAIVTEYGGGIGNAGIIDLGDQTVIFDTFNTPQAARDLRKAAEDLIGNPVSYVVNSHWHGDHIRGNQSFEDCKIISTVHTRELMEEIHPPRIKQQQQTIDQLIEIYPNIRTRAKSTEGCHFPTKRNKRDSTSIKTRTT
jgi:glyoxylase-like metal-dependent hydrolase (beta-lactamase superfamily II)